MAHWYLTCHGNAVNLDFARQVYIREGHDGLFRLVGEFVINASSGETIDYSLESGFGTEDEAEASMRRILFASQAAQPPAEIRQIAPNGRRSVS